MRGSDAEPYWPCTGSDLDDYVQPAGQVNLEETSACVRSVAGKFTVSTPWTPLPTNPRTYQVRSVGL